MKRISYLYILFTVLFIAVLGKEEPLPPGEEVRIALCLSGSESEFIDIQRALLDALSKEGDRPSVELNRDQWLDYFAALNTALKKVELSRDSILNVNPNNCDPTPSNITLYH